MINVRSIWPVMGKIVLGFFLGVLLLLFFIGLEANAMVLEYDENTGEINKTISDDQIYGTRVLSNKVQFVLYGNFVDNYALDDIGLNYDVKNNRAKVYSGQKYVSDDGMTWFSARYATTSLDEFFKATTKEVSGGFFKYLFPYANAQSVSTTTIAGDGIVKYNDALAWSTIYNASNGTAFDYTTGAVDSLHYCYRADGKYFTARHFLPFGTHFLSANYPDYSIATASVFFKHYTETTDEGNDGITFYLSTSTQASPYTLTTDDIEEVNKYSVVSNGVLVDGGAAWYEFEITATSTINTNDWTLYGTIDECMYNNSAPGSSYYRDGWYFVESAGNEPYLEIGLYEASEPATSTEATSTSISIPCNLQPNNELSMAIWCVEEWGDSTTSPEKTYYGYAHIPFFIWIIIAIPTLWLAGRLLLEFIIRLRRY